MLVPAMAFAWWIVSVSAHGHATHHAVDQGRAPGDTSEASAEAAGDARKPQTEDPMAPALPAQDSDDTSATEDTAGERVRLKVVTPAIVRAARTYLDLPMGTERAESIDGRRYVFVLERHYHPPGFVGGPHGWHKGVTVYEMR